MVCVRKDLSFNDLMEECWSGAIYTLETIEKNDKEDDLIFFLEEVFYGETPDMTELNDFLWFEDEYIFECLGIDEE